MINTETGEKMGRVTAYHSDSSWWREKKLKNKNKKALSYSKHNTTHSSLHIQHFNPASATHTDTHTQLAYKNGKRKKIHVLQQLSFPTDTTTHSAGHPIRTVSHIILHCTARASNLFPLQTVPHISTNTSTTAVPPMISLISFAQHINYRHSCHIT